MKRVTLSVGQMEQLLANQQNRTLSKRWMALADEMRTGRFNPEVSPIILYTDGTLADGQHRLRAAVEIGAPFSCWVTEIQRDEIVKVDSGRTRTTNDHLRILGTPMHTSFIAASRMCLWLRDGDWSRRSYSHQDVIDASHYYGVLRWSMPYSRMPGWAQLVAVCSYACVEGPGVELSTEFFECVSLGESLRRGDPRLTLRNRLVSWSASRGGAVQLAKLWVVVRSWYAWRAGETLTHIKLPASIDSLEVHK